MLKLLFLTFVTFTTSLASGAEDLNTTVPLTESYWTITTAENRGETRNENMQGREAMFVNNGRLDLKNVEFDTGIIEFDILTHGERGFGGIRWHVQPNQNSYEEFYIRPHMSGNPDANQYTPVFNGVAGWQLYFGNHYSAPVTYTPGEWIHIKIVVADEQAEVYIDSEIPVLFIDELKGDFEPGGLSLSAGFSPFYFANFSYRNEEKPQLKGSPLAKEDLPQYLVTQFSVSPPFAEALVSETATLPKRLSARSWTPVEVESNGIANLARLIGPGEAANTVIARVKIRSDTKQIKTLHFGYSDRVRIFLGDLALYAGDNGYRTRDYRYLGTVGLFDQLYLPLKPGVNELYFAVSESFGGWGIMAAFENMDGIEIL